MSIFTNIKYNNESGEKRLPTEDVKNISIDKQLSKEKIVVKIDQVESKDKVGDIEITKKDKVDDQVSVATSVLSDSAQSIPDNDLVELKHILEDGKEINEAYEKLSSVEQDKFRKQGESIVLIILETLRSVHVNVQKIFKLILQWLKKLPGINKYFLEQEAKIKTDKILRIKK